MSTPSNNYAPPQSVVADVPSGTATFEKASRVSRLAAVFIDGLIFGAPLTPSYLSAFHSLNFSRPTQINYFSFWSAVAASGTMFYVAAVVDLVLIAITTALVYKNAQTIGKKLLGIKVARTDGSRATLGRIFWLRYLLNTALTMVPVLGGLYALVDTLMIFGEPRRCCHDYIADTIVIQA
jgi:uncharacterized RDD family membrane protein YckC